MTPRDLTRAERLEATGTENYRFHFRQHPSEKLVRVCVRALARRSRSCVGMVRWQLNCSAWTRQNGSFHAACARTRVPLILRTRTDLCALGRAALKFPMANPNLCGATALPNHQTYVLLLHITAKTKFETDGNGAPKVLKSPPLAVLDGSTRTT